MSVLLYRLGRGVTRRPWAVIIIWALLVAGLAAGAVGLGKPFTSKMTIPGTEFQTVIDDLERALPSAAGGSGTVVFATTDGRPFTDSQQQAVAEAVSRWDAVNGVASALDPFAAQRQLDDGRAKVTTGVQELADGKAAITTNEAALVDGRARIAAGQATIDANAARLAEGRTQLTAAAAQLAEGQRQIDANAAKLAAGRQQLRAGEAQLATGKQQYADGLAQVTAGEQQLAAGRAQLAAGQTQLAGLIAQTDALAAVRGESDPQVVAMRQQIATTQATLAATEQTLTAKAAQLAAARQTLTAKAAEIAAGERRLAASRAQLTSGEQQLAAARSTLAAGRAAYQSNLDRVTAGEQQLAQGRADLEAAKATLADGERQLADGKAKLAANEPELVRAQRRLAVMDGMRLVSADGTIAMSRISFDKPGNEVAKATKAAIPEIGDTLRDKGIRVEYSKEISTSINLAGPGEVIGVVVAFLVLVVMLGSLLAAGMPLLTALVGVAVGLLGAVTLTHWIEMTDVTPALALMLGLAVGIDYSLFLVNRHRESLARGIELRESIARATGTAGGAVVFAGLTVVVALAALNLTGIPFLGVMGNVAAGTVVAAVLVAVTLTPALLTIIGARVLSPKARRAMAEKLAAEESEASAEDAHLGHGHGWGGLVTRHPWITIIAGTLLLGTLAIPAAGLKLGLPDGGSEPRASSAYQAYSLIGRGFGPGQNGPILVVAKVDPAVASTLTEATSADLQLDIAERLTKVSGVSYVVPVTASEDRRTLVWQLVPASGPSDDATTGLVDRLRTERVGVVDATALDSLGFAGQTVANIDISKRLADALPVYLGVVVGISLLLLLLVFRSLAVPVLATAGFVLSVAAAFGSVVAVYQWGWLATIFGVEHPGPVLSFLPTLVVGILFGLAMDYQMFLVSGMREAWAHGHTARAAVRTGFSHGARVVTAAALIMTSVFASFVHAEMTMVRPIGFALAIGVLIDAFVVRMTAMPAIMHLFGEKAWYLPRWLDRILPDLDVEGTKLEAARAAYDSSDPKTAGGAAELGAELPEPTGRAVEVLHT
ncbi:MAG TPA: MMPL family transporter [Dermatophilaceae bacterium]|nr:MMPL family transporter [Dermatophilaceae bacterium]